MKFCRYCGKYLDKTDVSYSFQKEFCYYCYKPLKDIHVTRKDNGYIYYYEKEVSK